MIKAISTKNAPEAIGPYSQGISVQNLYFFSGMLGIDPTTGELRSTVQGQIDQIFLNIDALLKAESLERNNIVKTTVFVKDLKDFPLVNEGFKTFFKPPYPARSTVEVSRLPKDGLVEIEIIASRS